MAALKFMVSVCVYFCNTKPQASNAVFCYLNISHCSVNFNFCLHVTRSDGGFRVMLSAGRWHLCGCCDQVIITTERFSATVVCWLLESKRHGVCVCATCARLLVWLQTLSFWFPQALAHNHCALLNIPNCACRHIKRGPCVARLVFNYHLNLLFIPHEMD